MTSLLNRLKGIFGSENQPEKEVGPLGLHLHAAFTLDILEYRLCEKQMLMELPGEEFLVAAQSTIELGAGCDIYRYYTSGDEFIQINTTGGFEHDNVSDIKLFVYDDSTGITDRLAWEKTISPNHIGLPNLTWRGKSWSRVFNNEEPGAAKPVYMLENVTNQQDETWPVHNFTMVYQRELDNSRYEYLMITGEETFDEQEQPEWLVSYALGIDLTFLQINVIG
ncbi:DUF2491 family protein [Buttiauxella agrestis]|uniref:YjfK family protein n=1 Tax=Buttiauxella agrestis ATCC 33320 TaxID=1006004 RepID=A0A085GKT4_9ENTR|nr:DUF2491 family protein [Buttiauxella agrestis]KFC84329.1 hypothetical protein GBAG_0319 [Buttiauxella agrestis ATCC 33320]